MVPIHNMSSCTDLRVWERPAAARAVMEEARTNFKSLFDPSSPFVEIDATAVRFDERGIADPLIGSVHDPIYQGAGKFGSAGIPQA